MFIFVSDFIFPLKCCLPRFRKFHIKREISKHQKSRKRCLANTLFTLWVQFFMIDRWYLFFFTTLFSLPNQLFQGSEKPIYTQNIGFPEVDWKLHMGSHGSFFDAYLPIISFADFIFHLWCHQWLIPADLGSENPIQ